MQEHTTHETTVNQNDYLEYAVPIIRQYLDSDESFTTELLQLVKEQDVEILSKNLGKMAKESDIPIAKLEAFLRNKDFVLDYSTLKAEQKEQSERDKLANSMYARANANSIFQKHLAFKANAQSPLNIDETRITTIARLSKEIHELTELLRSKSLELNALVNAPENEVDNRPSPNIKP